MKLFTPLSRDELERLRELAQAERRRTQDQAALLIAEGLERRGLVQRQAKSPPDRLAGTEPVPAP